MCNISGEKDSSFNLASKVRTSSEEVLAAMLRGSNVPISTDSSQSIYSSYISGKMTRQPFPIKQFRATIPFEKIHTNVWVHILH